MRNVSPSWGRRVKPSSRTAFCSKRPT
jgi:hypothetical protein